jgi:BirA family biotin operon repressor/biotin-[acetyl-CoA-carboxylase] ligase
MLPENLKYIRKILIYNQLASTNDFLLELVSKQEPSGTVVIAKEQSRGRGRLSRLWSMTEGDIAMSLLLRSEHLPDKHMSLLAWVPALAVVDAANYFDIKLNLKWPNDIVIKVAHKNKYSGCFEKVGGILIDNIIKQQKIQASIIGIGINIMSQSGLKEILPHVNWLSSVKPELSYDKFMSVLLQKLDDQIHKILQPNGDVYAHERYAELCVSIGQELVISTDSHELRGRAVGLSADGFLIIHDGYKNHIIYSGDINYS